MLTKEQIEKAKAWKLSENFSLFELIKSDTYPELVQWPSSEVISELEYLAKNVLQPIRDKWGPIRVNSGFRNPALNKRVGGVSNSVHQIEYRTTILGAATDIVPVTADIIDVFEWAFHHVGALKTIIIYRKKTVCKSPFIHIDTRKSRPQKVQLEKFGPNDYRPYSK